MCTALFLTFKREKIFQHSIGNRSNIPDDATQYLNFLQKCTKTRPSLSSSKKKEGCTNSDLG